MIRWTLWSLLALVVLGPAWLLGTPGGLHALARLAERATGGALEVGPVEGRLLGDFSISEIHYRTPGVAVTVEGAELNLRLLRLVIGRIQAERLVVKTVAVATQGPERPTVNAPHEPLTVWMPLRLAVEEGRLDEFRLRLATWDEDWRVTGATFAAHWRDQWIVIARLRATTAEAGTVDTSGRIAIVEDLLQFENVEARATGIVRIDGAMALDDGTQNALDVEWQDLTLPRELAPWFASRQGKSRLEGPWQRFAWRTEAHVHLYDVPGDLHARGTGNLRSLHVQHAELKALDGELHGDARLDWSGPLRTEAAVQFRRIDPAEVWPAWPASLTGSARLKAQWGTPTLLEFDGTLADSQLRGYPFALQATGRTEDRKVFLRQLVVTSGSSALRASGQLLPEMALAGSLASDDLGALWAGLSGTAQLQASAHGTFAAPRVAAKGTIDRFAYERYRVAHADVDVQFAPRGQSRIDLRLADLDLGVPLRTLSASGAGTAKRHRLRLEAAGLETTAAVALEGGLQGERWRGALVEARVTPPQGLPWSLEERAPMTYAAGRFDSEPVCLSATTSRACAQLGLAPGAQRLAFRLRNFDLQHLRAWLPPEWGVTGAVTGTTALRLRGGELVALNADLAGTAGAIEAGGVRLEYGPGSVKIQPDADRLHAQVMLRPAGGEVSGEAWIAPGRDFLDRPMLGDIKLRLPDLAWLPVLSTEITSAQGALSADLQVSGTPRSPTLDGRVHLTGGRIELTTPGIELTDMTASFERGRGAPLTLQAQAKSGDGLIVVAGQLQTLQPKLTGEITVKGQDVLGFNRPDIRAWLSPDLKLVLDGTTARLTGELQVPRAEITPRELNQRGVGPSGDQVMVEPEAGDPAAAHGVQVETEVRIALGDNVRFDGLGLKTRLTGAITAFDDPGRPTRGRGELRLDGGRYKAYGQELQIETGRLIFAGGPVTDPAIDIKAVRKPREDIKVGLRARGSLDAPEFSLFSEPAMSQEEQLSWLVLGRSLSATLSSGQRTQLSSAAVSLGLTGGEYLAGKLAPRLGLDEVSLGARPGETADLARFTIGKYLSPKLFVSYGYGLFQPGHFFRLQYDIGKRFKLVGESGTQQGGDLLYTIER